MSTLADNLRAAGWRCMAAGKYDIGMHTWAHTPTFRGFEHFVGFYNGELDRVLPTALFSLVQQQHNATDCSRVRHTQSTSLVRYFRAKRFFESVACLRPNRFGCCRFSAAEDHFTHEVGKYLDLRNDTKPLRSAASTYSTHLYSAAVVDFIVANAPAAHTPPLQRDLQLETGARLAAAAVTEVGAPTCASISLRHNWSAGGATAATVPAKDAAACCSVCSANASCCAFSFQARTCYLKNEAVEGHAVWFQTP